MTGHRHDPRPSTPPADAPDICPNSCPGPCADSCTCRELADSRAETAAARGALAASRVEHARLMADMGHHVRTPLTAIIGYASLLTRSDDLSPTARAQARRIEDAGHVLAANIAMLLGGADSAPTPGSAPASDAEAPRSDRAVAADGLRGLSALVVDDHPHVRDILAITLEAFGMQVSTVADGPAFLERLSGQTFDVVLMDYRMPGLSGREVLDLIRSGPGPNRRTRVIAVTAELSPLNAPAFAAFDGMVTKPIAVDTLVQALSTLIAVPDGG